MWSANKFILIGLSNKKGHYRSFIYKGNKKDQLHSYKVLQLIIGNILLIQLKLIIMASLKISVFLWEIFIYYLSGHLINDINGHYYDP